MFTKNQLFCYFWPKIYFFEIFRHFQPKIEFIWQFWPKIYFFEYFEQKSTFSKLVTKKRFFLTFLNKNRFIYGDFTPSYTSKAVELNKNLLFWHFFLPKIDFFKILTKRRIFWTKIDLSVIFYHNFFRHTSTYYIQFPSTLLNKHWLFRNLKKQFYYDGNVLSLSKLVIVSQYVVVAIINWNLKYSGQFHFNQPNLL